MSQTNIEKLQEFLESTNAISLAAVRVASNFPVEETFLSTEDMKEEAAGEILEILMPRKY